jgi:hypothetical protein
MPNDVLRATDAVLVLGVEDTSTPEGEAADAVVSQYDLSNVVGRLTNVSISVSSDVRPFYEIGRRYPTHLRPGILRVSGTAERAHVNGALLRLLLGDGSVSPPSGPSFAQPSFNLISTLKDPARPEPDDQGDGVRRQVRQLDLQHPERRLRDGSDHLPGDARRLRGNLIGTVDLDHRAGVPNACRQSETRR